MDLHRHELHSHISPPRPLAPYDLRGRRSSDNSRCLRGTLGLAIVFPPSATKQFLSFPCCARIRIPCSPRVPLGAGASALESAQPVGDRVPFHCCCSSAP